MEENDLDVPGKPPLLKSSKSLEFDWQFIGDEDWASGGSSTGGGVILQ